MSAYIPNATWYDYETVSNLNLIIDSPVLYCQTSLHQNLTPNKYHIYFKYSCYYYKRIPNLNM